MLRQFISTWFPGASMSRACRQKRFLTGRHFYLEPLETRQLLAGVSGMVSIATPLFSSSSGNVSPSGIVATPAATTANVSPADASNAAESIITTSPANGAALTQSPTSLTVTFSQEVDFLWADGDVQLEQVNSDGTTTPLFDPTNPPASYYPTGCQATIPLSQTLAPGHYRIALVGGTDVSAFVGTNIWDWTVDQTLADFTIVQPTPVQRAPTLSDARDLRTVGTQIQSVSGSLDLSHGVQNVDLYRVTLAPGQQWRLGLELDAQQIGSALRGALTLFDQQGHVLATRDAGTGRPAFPADPYLFADLNPGVYYIGVSGAGNLAGQPGGYDPVAGTFGTSGQAQAGGAYNLQLVADPVAPTLSDARDLGTVGTQIQSVSGSLDLSHGVQNVDLYKVTLAPGQQWRLGLELDAQQIGSALRGALTLFDQQGHVLATRDAGTGRPAFPADPYLFTDLDPGVYYIGVSGAGNLAGQPGGYDPVAGTFGTSGQAQVGGAYSLQLVADPVVPTSVIGVGLQWGDLQGASPTGLLLAFSGPIDISSVKQLVHNHALSAVDQSGHLWNLTPDSYQESQGEVGFVFDQPLPPGQYTLINSLINSVGGIRDLGGQPPVANGLPQGELATWTVPARTVPSDPGNMGVVWPSQAEGVSQSVMILPGQSTTSRVVIPVGGPYTLDTSVMLGTLAIQRQGPGGTVVVNPAQGTPLVLAAGVYEFTFQAVGSQSALATWQLKPALIDYESLIDNGVGQTPALSLRLLDFTSSNLTTTSPPGSPGLVPGDTSPTAEPAAPAAAPAVASGSATAVALPQGPTATAAQTPGVSPIYGNLLVTVNSGLLGEPSSQVGPIGVVGPTVPNGSMVTTDRSPGFSTMLAGHWYGQLENTDSADAGTNRDAHGDGVRIAAVDLETAAGDVTLESADALAISRSDRIVELGLLLGRWLSPAVITGAQEIPNGAPSALPEMLAAIEAERVRVQGLLQPGHSDRIDQADLAIPTGLIVVSAAAYRLRQFAGRSWRRFRSGPWSQTTAQSRQSGTGSGTGPGPRSFRRSAAAPTFVRAPRHRQTICD